jgi:hypothetical protein
LDGETAIERELEINRMVLEGMGEGQRDSKKVMLSTSLDRNYSVISY